MLSHAALIGFSSVGAMVRGIMGAALFRPSSLQAARGPVLLIESDATLGHQIGRMLRELGCTVLFAADARGASEIVREVLPTLLVVDLRMPAARSLDVHREVVAAWPRARLIVLHPGALHAQLFRGAVVLHRVDGDELVRHVDAALRPTDAASPVGIPSPADRPSLLTLLDGRSANAVMLAEESGLSTTDVRSVMKELLAAGLVQRHGRTRWTLSRSGLARVHLRG